MTARRCGYAYALLVAVEIVVMAWSHGTPWRGEWNWTLDHAVGTTVLTGPLVGTFAAWISAEERPRSVLVDSTARGWLAPVRTAVMASLVGIVAFVTTLLGALVATVTVPHGGPADLWIVGIVVPVFAFNAGLGSAVGHLWPQRVVVVLVAPALFLLGGLAEFGIGPSVVRQGPSTGSLAGLAFDPATIGLQAIVLTGAIVLLVAAQAARQRIRLAIAVPAVLAGALAMLSAGAALGSHSDDRLRLSDERPSACIGSAPEVCLAPSNRRSLEAVSRQIRRAARPLIEAGANVPSRYVAELPARHGPMDAGVVILPAEANLAGYRLFDAVQQIARAAPCRAWYGNVAPPPAAFEAQQLVSSWVLGQLGKPPFGWSMEAETWLRETPAAEQRSAVVGIFEELRNCELDGIKLPWSPR